MDRDSLLDQLDRLATRFPGDPAAVRAAAGRDEWDHLAQSVRGARLAEELSQSELARRAGISPSVISRIEAGLVRTPDDRTTHRIATALGRSGTVLRFIAEGATQQAADEIDIPVLREAKAELEAAMSSGTDTVDDSGIVWKWEPEVMDALVEHFVATKGLDDLDTDDLASDTRWAVEQFVSHWTALSERRKDLVLEYVRDQAFLSAIADRPLD